MAWNISFIGSEQVPEGDDMLAYTVFGGEQYFALHSQVPKGGICTYVIDEAGLECLVKDFGNRYLIVPVAVKCSEETLIKKRDRAGQISEGQKTYSHKR